MKYNIVILALGLWILSACTCLECETFSPEEIDKFSTAMALQSPLLTPIASDDKPTVICYGEYESDIWDDVQATMKTINNTFGDAVVIIEASADTFTGQFSFDILELEQVPACLLYDDNRQEIFRTYDDFSFPTFEPQIRQILDE